MKTVQGLMGQIQRRIRDSVKNPHEKKMFSIFEEHTRCTAVTSQVGRWNWGGRRLQQVCRQKYLNLYSLSFDRGFRSLSNR